MSTVRVQATVDARVSNLNGDKDIRDLEKWRLFVQLVRRAAESPEFRELDIFVANAGEV